VQVLEHACRKQSDNDPHPAFFGNWFNGFDTSEKSFLTLSLPIRSIAARASRLIGRAGVVLDFLQVLVPADRLDFMDTAYLRFEYRWQS
jgi:hypothetical protein